MILAHRLEIGSTCSNQSDWIYIYIYIHITTLFFSRGHGGIFCPDELSALVFNLGLFRPSERRQAADRRRGGATDRVRSMRRISCQ